jgi:hypothetical protein
MPEKKASKKLQDKQVEPSKDEEDVKVVSDKSEEVDLEHPGGSEEEEERIDETVEKEVEQFHKKITARPHTVSFTPSLLQKQTRIEVEKTWKPLAAGSFLLAIAIVGLITSSNLILTVYNQPLYSPNEGGLKGYILNKDGERLAGARVGIIGTTLIRYTDTNGHYEFRSIPKGERVLIISYPGYRTVRFPTMILGGTQVTGIGDTNLTLTKVNVMLTDLTVGADHVKGRVLDNNLNPEFNATVKDEATGNTTHTDHNGTFDLGTFPTGKRTLVVSLAGFYTQHTVYFTTTDLTLSGISLTPGSGNMTADLTQGVGILSGTVIDEYNRPVPYALIDINGTAQVSDAQGHFSLSIDAGVVTVTATGISKTTSGVKTYVGSSGEMSLPPISVMTDIPTSMSGDRQALKDNLTTCGIAIIAMSAFMICTAVFTFLRRRFWISVTGSLFGAVMMLVTFQYAIVLGIIAFILLVFARREFE